MGCSADSSEIRRRIARNRLAGPGAGGRGPPDAFGDITRGYAFARVAASTRRTYEGSWRMWVNWRSFAGNMFWLQKGMGGMALVAELEEFMRYCCSEKGNQETTNAGQPVATDFTASSS